MSTGRLTIKRHCQFCHAGAWPILQFSLARTLARPVRLERTACGFEVRRSIQLSYGRINGVSEGTRTLDHWGHNPVLYPTELHSPSLKESEVNGSKIGVTLSTL